MTVLHANDEGAGDHIPAPDAEEILLPPASRWVEISIGLAALALSLLALYLARDIRIRVGAGGLDAKWWPTQLALAGICLSVLLTCQALFSKKLRPNALDPAHSLGIWRLGVTLTLTVLFLFFWKYVGILVPATLYLFALLLLYGMRKWGPLLLYPLSTVALIWVLFKILLRVPL